MSDRTPQVLGHYTTFLEYQIITKFYGDKTAKRSGVPLINHIIEGVEILLEIEASNLAVRAYIIHPIIQADEALTWENIDLLVGVDYKVILLAMEYRKTANAYLSKRKISSIDEIELSPLREVNQMLWADKKQNMKDFMLHHYEKHERSNELLEYFNNWTIKLTTYFGFTT